MARLVSSHSELVAAQADGAIVKSAPPGLFVRSDSNLEMRGKPCITGASLFQRVVLCPEQQPRGPAPGAGDVAPARQWVRRLAPPLIHLRRNPGDAFDRGILVPLREVLERASGSAGAGRPDGYSRGGDATSGGRDERSTARRNVGRSRPDTGTVGLDACQQCEQPTRRALANRVGPLNMAREHARSRPVRSGITKRYRWIAAEPPLLGHGPRRCCHATRGSAREPAYYERSMCQAVACRREVYDPFSGYGRVQECCR